MLSTLLTSLGTYFSKYFVVASFLPMLAFAFFNAATGYAFVESWRDWVSTTFFGTGSSTTRTTVLTTAITVGILGAAYVLSALNNYLRGLLEGKWPESLRKLFLDGQMKRYQTLDQRIVQVNRVRVDLAASGQGWIDQLRAARIAGDQPSVAPNPAKGNTFVSSQVPTVVAGLAAIKRQQAKGELIDPIDLQALVTGLDPHLRSHSASIASTANQKALGDLQQQIVLAINFATERAESEHLRLYNLMSSSFGADQIAPTTMGNVANTAQAYAVRRYDCNLALFWNDLQRVDQKDEAAYAVLLESKAQLDFLIASCWLTTAYWLIWLVISVRWSYSVEIFVALALLGPLGSYFWYRAATEHYRSFVDVLTTTLNQFRLKLLRELSLKAPADVEDERILWNNLHRLASFEGDVVNLKYEKPTA